MVILDEILGIIDEGIASGEEIANILRNKNENTKVILTGRELDEAIRNEAGEVYHITSEK